MYVTSWQGTGDSIILVYYCRRYEATQAGRVCGGRCKHCDTPLTLFCLTCQRPALQHPLSESPAMDAVSTLMPEKVAVKPGTAATRLMETLSCQTGMVSFAEGCSSGLRRPVYPYDLGTFCTLKFLTAKNLKQEWILAFQNKVQTCSRCKRMPFILTKHSMAISG